MVTEIRLPKLGMTMEKGTVVAWVKKPGERVRKGEPLVQVETEKAICEVECPADGVLARIMAPEGAKVTVDGVIALLEP